MAAFPLTGREGWNALLARAEPLLALAPMQDVTDLPFWRLMTRYGGADVYYTEYFRVTTDSRLEKGILRSITENPTGRPVVAQMIGNDEAALVRNARELEQHAVAAIDLNLGCPAPVVYRKCAGGGLLRDVPRIERILEALREAITGAFTVKTRLGFDDERTLDELVPVFERQGVDLVTVHGRTVKQMYRDGVRYDLIARAAADLPCPVLANGNVSSAPVAETVLRETGVRGMMIGRGAVRNPWIFEQIRCHLRGEPVVYPTGREVLVYLHDLYETVCSPGVAEGPQVHAMKKYANFIGVGIPDGGEFLHAIRRVNRRDDFFAVCARALDHDEPMTMAPVDGGVAVA